MNQPSIATKLFFKILEKAQNGQILIQFPDGKTKFFGQGQTVAKLKFEDWKTIDLLISKGDIGLAEAIIDDKIQVDDMTALVEWACRNDTALGRAMDGKWWGTLAYQLKKILSRNSQAQAKKNIMAHYDLGNDFYRTWLDSSMTYSSALFKNPSEGLTEAQFNKYDRLIDLLQITEKDHILEIGCGWGGFFSRAVERTGCKVTAVMNSPSQARNNRELIQRKGYAGYVDLKEIDYRQIEGRFDKIVSIEMIEAVGKEYWNTYFQKVSNSLKNKGQAMIQSITIRDDLFYSYSQQTDFIQSYIFPGGMLLSNQIFKEMGQKNNIPLNDLYEFGPSYAETLKLWRIKFNNSLDLLRTMGFDDRFFRMWNLYLSYCEGAFRAGRINVGHFKLG